MKKVLLFVAVAGFLATSCAKDFECECTYDVGGTSIKTTTILKDSKKSAAAAVCEGKGIGSYAYIDEDGNEQKIDNENNCELK